MNHSDSSDDLPHLYVTRSALAFEDWEEGGYQAEKLYHILSRVRTYQAFVGKIEMPN